MLDLAYICNKNIDRMAGSLDCENLGDWRSRYATAICAAGDRFIKHLESRKAIGESYPLFGDVFGKGE